MMAVENKSIQRAFITGDAIYTRTSPPREKVSASTQILNFEFTLEEALKLRLALDERCLRVNRYKQSTREGRRARVGLAIHFGPQRIVAYEAKAKKE
jgi:hypothetical protein